MEPKNELNIKGQVVYKSKSLAEYEELNARWNIDAVNNPSVIVVPNDTDDVVSAVNYARENNLEIAVRCGGHSTQSVTEGGLIVDLRRLRTVKVDTETDTCLVEGGCLLGDVDRETAKYGKAIPFGHVSHTGVGGLVLGGGIGNLSRIYGLSVDNLLSVEMVLATGKVVKASNDENSDLFWAIRGGGGNFGVVTKFWFKLNPCKDVLVGTFVYPVPVAREALLEIGRQQDANAIPNELSYAVSITPNGVVVMPLWIGDVDQGKVYLEAFSKIGSPVVSVIRTAPFVQIQSQIDDKAPHGLRYYQKGPFLKSNLTAEIVDSILDSYQKHPTKICSILLTHLQGAVQNYSKTDTAYHFRDASYQIIFMSILPDQKDRQAVIDWTKESIQKIEPHLYKEYINTTGQNYKIEEVFGVNYPRLLEIKKKYDPENFFRACANIKE